jgi:AcrR family transcriptional regulator
MARNALTTQEIDSMRERLCEHALALVRSSGIEAVTFRALADSVGVSHTMPYRYFENKEALLASVRVLCFQRFELHVREHEERETSAMNQVFAVLDAYVSFVFEHKIEYELIFATPQPPPQRYPELLAARIRLFEHSVELVEQCIAEGLIQGDARELTHTLWATLHGLLTLQVANQLVHGCTLQQLVKPSICRILGIAASDTYAKQSA